MGDDVSPWREFEVSEDMTVKYLEKERYLPLFKETMSLVAWNRNGEQGVYFTKNTIDYPSEAVLKEVEIADPCCFYSSFLPRSIPY